MVNEAAHGRMRHQAGRRHALVDYLWLHRFLHQGLAALAGPFPADVAVHEKIGRNQLFSVSDLRAYKRTRQ